MDQDQSNLTVVSAPKKKTKSDKLQKLIIFTVGALILAVILELYGVFSFIKVRLFWGDRLSGEVRIMVNEKECFPSSVAVKFNDSQGADVSLSDISDVEELTDRKDEIKEDDELVKGDFGINVFATPGGDNGEYKLDFVISRDDIYAITGDSRVKELKDDIHISVKYSNEKWYYITHIYLDAILVTDENGLAVNLKGYLWTDNAKRLKITGQTIKTEYINLMSPKDQNTSFDIYLEGFVKQK